MSEINWEDVSQPFQYNRSQENWVTNGVVDIQENDDNTYTVTNETVGLSASAPTLEEALSKLTGAVRESVMSGKAFIGRGY